MFSFGLLPEQKASPLSDPRSSLLSVNVCNSSGQQFQYLVVVLTGPLIPNNQDLIWDSGLE